MSLVNRLFGVLKKLALFVVILAVAIPLRYGSTNPMYLRLRLFHSALAMKHAFLSDQARATLSADYRAFEEIMSMKPLAELDPNLDILAVVKEIRSGFSMGTLVPKPPQCQIHKEVFAHNGHTVDTYWIDNHQKNIPRHSDRILLYFHGGGYMLGDIHGYSGFECHLSQLLNVTVLHLEYRLCPEYALPAAVEDATALYQALLRENISPSQLLIMGDSAGGGLSLLTVQALVTQKIPLPRAIIVLSPWTDLSASGESHERNRHADVMFRNTKTDDKLIKSMLGLQNAQLPMDDPVYSPLFGSFKGLPPMYINVGTAEILEDDSRRVYQKAQEAGVDVTFEEGLHLMHVYPIFFSYYPEGRNTLKDIHRWVETVFRKEIKQ